MQELLEQEGSESGEKSSNMGAREQGELAQGMEKFER